jgi:predicted aspartyl protease
MGYSEASFRVTNNGLLVDASINGVSGEMVIDTGADLSLVDSRFAARANLKTYKSTRMRALDAAGTEIEPEFADPASFKIGGVEGYHPKLQVTPISFYLPSGGKVIGLLGMDFIGQSWGIIDFAQRKLYFAVTK